MRNGSSKGLYQMRGALERSGRIREELENYTDGVRRKLQIKMYIWSVS